MNLEVLQTDDELTRLKLSGRLDLAGVQEIQSKFYGYTAARKKPTLVDFSDVTFLASLGIRMLVEAAKGLKTNKSKLVILNPQPLVEKSIKASGLDVILGICHSEEEALAALKPQQ